MDLRKEFFKEMADIARKDKDVILLVGDLGYSFMEDFAYEFPKQFINAGASEQNMIGVAAGLAIGGKKPYVYSGSIFLASRAHEFIRDDVAYNNLNVKLIGTGASGFLGFTHNFGEDENEDNLFEGMPNLRTYYPENEDELCVSLLPEGPSYIRI
jgi:transketolase